MKSKVSTANNLEVNKRVDKMIGWWDDNDDEEDEENESIYTMVIIIDTIY